MSTYTRTTPYTRRRTRRRRPAKIFTRNMRITLFFFFVLFIAFFCFLLMQIYKINKNDGDRYRKAAMSQQSYTNTILNYQRGSIKDRNNTMLAVSIRKYNLVLEPRTRIRWIPFRIRWRRIGTFRVCGSRRPLRGIIR